MVELGPNEDDDDDNDDDTRVGRHNAQRCKFH